MSFQNPSSESRSAMGQILSSDVAASSSTSNVSEPNSISQNPVEQIPNEEPSDQLKNGGEAVQLKEPSDQLKNGEEADQLKQPSDQLKNGGEADGLKNRGEADESKDREAEAASGKEKVEEEEEGECGFCLFMKGGGCRDSFTEWEKCMEEAEKNKEDVVEKCFEITSNLKKCMEAHADYYEPILRAEKAAEEEVTKELEREAQKKKDEQIAAQASGMEDKAE